MLDLDEGRGEDADQAQRQAEAEEAEHREAPVARAGAQERVVREEERDQDLRRAVFSELQQSVHAERVPVSEY